MTQIVSKIEDMIVPGTWDDEDYETVVWDRILEELGLEDVDELD